MPNFPTYPGELPACLSPLNPRHYLLLAYWIFFRPTGLKCYLYQADPHLYRATGFAALRRAWRQPPYRSALLMGLVLTVALTLPMVLLASWVQGRPINWPGVLVGVLVGVAYGVAFGVFASMSDGVLVGVAFGVAFGVLGVVLSGVVFGVLSGVAFSVAFGVAFGVLGGVAFGVAFGVLGGVAFGVMVGMMGGVLVGVLVGVVFGVLGGVLGGVLVGVAGGMLGGMRGLFYLFELIAAGWSTARHPIAWDELAVLPLPGSARALERRLGLRGLAALPDALPALGNPFQRWAAQRALVAYLHGQPEPLHTLYLLLSHPDLDVYCVTLPNKRIWRELPAARMVILSELCGRPLPLESRSDRLARRLTRRLRDPRVTPLTNFAGLLYKLLDEAWVDDEAFDLTDYREVYSDLRDYLGGTEIAATFEAMAQFCNYADLKQLPGATALAGALPRPEAPIRPGVLEALARLGLVGSEVRRYQEASSRVNRLAALSRAADGLEQLDEYVVAEIAAPEQAIVRRVIRQWRRLVSEAGGMVGRAVIAGPVANPYVAGNPVIGDLFVGREDVLRRLEELWAGEGQRPSVVLYGHRRMGKSSILHNLGQGARFGAHTLVVDFNMQRVGLVANTGELLHNLALALYDSLDAERQRALAEPAAKHFGDANPYTSFDRFLKQLDRVRSEQRFIVAVDEFELIEQQINDGQLEKRLLDFWRSLIQTYPWFVMAFAGLHTLQEMREDYWNPLFGSVTAIEVSFLPHADAERLIAEPSPDFDIDYEPAAIEQIIALTNGQPYLIQLIGHALVTRFNRQMAENAGFAVPMGVPIVVGPDRRFTAADVAAVIDAPEFYRDGDAYFGGVWRQAETDRTPHQAAILGTLAQSEHGLSEEELAGAARLTREAAHEALDALRRHDVAVQSGDCWRFTVELMRRWVARRASGP